MITPPSARLHVLTDADALFHAAAEHLLAIGQAAIAASGSFHLSLAGGSTPHALYALLADQPERLDWSRVHLYFGDERAVPPDSPDSNYLMVKTALIDRLPVAPRVHRMQGELDATEAAERYAAELATHLPAGGLDLALLGMGTDGHIASLFPEGRAIEENNKTVVAEYIQKMNGWRISLTLPVFNQSRQVMLLVSGADKAEMVHRVLSDTAVREQRSTLPVERLAPPQPPAWFMDAAAARLLPAAT